MAQHLKSIIKNRLKSAVAYYAPHSEISASHRRGVCYAVPVVGIDMLWGAFNTVKEGTHYKKHIIIRRVPRNGGQLLQLYTYHFPKSWSAACVANRELIKTAQKLAHALEHDHSLAAMEWRIRFFLHFFRVVKGGAQPEPGMKRYSRFYQYTYVALYRELKAAKEKAEQQPSEDISFEDVSFNSIDSVASRFARTASRRDTVYTRLKHSFGDGETESMSTRQYVFRGYIRYPNGLGSPP